MIRSAVMFAAAGAATMLPGCAQPAAPAAAAPSGRECFFAGSVNSFTARSDEIVDVRAGARRYFRLQLAGVCPGVNWRNRVALRTRGGSSWICQGLDAEIIVPEPGIGAQRCLVRSVRRLSDAEARALRYYR